MSIDTCLLSDRQTALDVIKAVEKYAYDRHSRITYSDVERWNPTDKAKLEIVESEILSFEEEFMPYILTADGQTFGEWIKPQLESHVPLMLPSPKEAQP